MTSKQLRFAEEYLVDTNATQAAIRAGYKKETAYSQGQRLLKHVEVKEYIEKNLKEMEDDRIATAKEVMIYLTSVARGESESEIVVIEGTGDGCSEARAMIKRPDEKERLKAAELLGKRFGLFKENVNVNAVPVIISGENELEE